MGGVEGPRVLMLIPSYVKQGVDHDQAVREDRHPTMDYYALQAAIGRASAEKVVIADYADVERNGHPMVRAALRAGKDAALAVLAATRRREFDVIFSNGENVSIPLAALLVRDRCRPGHVLIGHRISARKKRPFFRALHRAMDAIFLYAGTQHAYALKTLGIPAAKLHLIPFHADHRFYRPMDRPVKNMICSAGLEWRDYPTLIDAVAGLDVEVKLAAASPWSKHKDETSKRELPSNVTARRYEYGELRELYAASRFVVVPLYDNDFQAGVTTILEAMAMGKAVIATRTAGQRDVIRDGENGIYVPPGDREAMRTAIIRLLERPAEADRIGQNARQTIVDSMTLDHWAARIARVARAAAPKQSSSAARGPGCLAVEDLEEERHA